MAYILIADDDPSVLKLMATILAKAGHTIAVSSSGSDTLKKLGLRPEDTSVDPPDLIILDIMMPKMDGYMVGKLIKDHPRTRAIPILAVSALRELSRLFTTTVEVQGFLSKPFSPEELIACVANIIQRCRLAG
jgi:CheY-like chemotaxis protein